MKRAPALLTWWYSTTGGIVTILALAVPWAGARAALFLVAAIQLVLVVFYSWRRGQLPARTAGLIGAVGVLFALAQLVSGDGPTYETPPAIALGLLAAGCIVGGLVVLVRRQGVQAHPGLLSDSIIVALGSWIISWAALVQPIVNNANTTAGSTFLFGLNQPSAAVILFLVMAILLNNSQRPAAMWLLAAGLTCKFLGDLIYALIDAGHLAVGIERLGLPLYIAAYFAAGAALLHPSISSIGESPAGPSRQLTGRLIMTIASLVLPVVAPPKASLPPLKMPALP